VDFDNLVTNMTTTTFQVFRETALPGSLAPYAIYYIAPAGQPNHVEIYVTDATGTATRRVLTAADVQSLINTSIASASNLTIVSNIAARNALAPTTSRWAYVTDATGDATVASGGATYLYNPTGSTWIKTSEAEALDVVATWASLTGKPSSAVADIDDAVAKRHTHANATQLNKIGEDGSGNMTYNGSLPATGWTTTAW
jgi:hypothetical protein